MFYDSVQALILKKDVEKRKRKLIKEEQSFVDSNNIVNDAVNLILLRERLILAGVGLFILISLIFSFHWYFLFIPFLVIYLGTKLIILRIKKKGLHYLKRLIDLVDTKIMNRYSLGNI